jgi:hypothetical protein
MRILGFLVSWMATTVVLGQSNASRYTEPFPIASSKKGLQVEMVDDALALGVKHAALNFDLCRLVDPRGDTNCPSRTMNGKTFRFGGPYLDQMDQRVKALSSHGVVVYLIVLAYQSSDAEVNRLMLHPGYSTNAPNHLGAFNTVTTEGREWFQASLEFVAERWSRPDLAFGRVAGFIMGNEVNSHWFWSNRGPATMQEFADDYLQVVRLAHDAVRRESSCARVYISLEHHWNIRYAAGTELQAFPARPFLDYFARRAREQGDFDWNIAFHPYPENLFEPRFWNDKTATTNEDTPRITFKNLEQLTAYVKRPELLYHGTPRHVILSEQGFHTPSGPDGETIQAAAFCYAYKKIEALDGVDAFIYHRHVDNPNEGGLLLGLRAMVPADGEPHPKKKIYESFRAADTPEWQKAFEFALPIVGLTNWPSR